MLFNIINFLTIVILIYYSLLCLWYTFLLVATFPEVLKKFRESEYTDMIHLMDSDSLMPITVVTPAYNEASRILNMVYAVLGSDYKNVTQIVVNDGSTDNTLELLKEEFSLYETPPITRTTIKTEKILHFYRSKTHENLIVIDKEHSPFNCAADAVNAGLNACKTPIMLTIDADTILEPEALSRMLFAFLSTPHCVAVSGSIYVLNDNRVEHGKMMETNLAKGYVGAIQSVDYLRSFLYGRSGLNVLSGALCFPGAFTLFETEILRDVGGFDTPNFAYDAEITTKMHHWTRQHNYSHTLVHTCNAFSWTQVPSTHKSFWKQRNLWQRGMWRTVFLHIGMLFNPKYGVVGLVSFPAYILFEVLGPFVEFTSYLLFAITLLFGLISVTVILWFLLLAWGFITFLSVAMIFLNLISFNKYNKVSDVLSVICLVFAEMLWFRQFRAACGFFSTFHYMFNRMLGKPL